MITKIIENIGRKVQMGEGFLFKDPEKNEGNC